MYEKMQYPFYQFTVNDFPWITKQRPSFGTIMAHVLEGSLKEARAWKRRRLANVSEGSVRILVIPIKSGS